MVVKILQWFVTTVALLTLTVMQACASGILVVKPTNESACPQQPCHTLEHYAHRWQFYLTSNTIMKFLPGEHVLKGDWSTLFLVNVSNLTLIGNNDMITSNFGIPEATSRISCKQGKSCFSFYNVNKLSIVRLSFSDCGGSIFHTTLLMLRVYNLVVDGVTVQNSIGSGLLGFSILGRSSISYSAFLFNTHSAGFPGGNVIFSYKGPSNCSNVTETFTLSINSSWMMFGNATQPGKTAAAGGLSVALFQSCFNMNIHIHNTTMKENVGGNGGNMVLMISSSARNNVTITESYFEEGYATTGAGIAIVLVTKHNNDAYQCVHRNTKFQENFASKVGGALTVDSSYSPCTAVYIDIDSCKFVNNTALENGGHIALKLHSDSYMNGLSITINNSIFDSGRARSDGGGGVLVWPTSSKNASCLFISNTPQKIPSVHIFNSKFYQNIARYGGGIAVQFDQSCFASHVTIHNVSLSRNTATNTVGGNLYIVQGRTGTGSLVTISSSIVEFGNASGAGGGVEISIKTHKTNMALSEKNHSPISIIIDNSTFQNNSAGYRGGGIAISFEQLCCSASVNITNTQVMYNRVDRKLIDGTNADTTGGNIDILHVGGQWLQSMVRIENSLIKGGMAGTGGGMSLIQQVYVWQNNTDNVPIEVLYISNTQFICNHAYSKTGGSSLLAGVQFSIHLPLQSNTPAITHLFNIKNTLFDGTCSDISNIKMVGRRYISYPTTTYNVIFSNVSVQGHLMKSSPPPVGAHYVSTITSLQPGLNLHYVSNVTLINCTFNESSPDGAIALSGTTIIFEGNITFSSNRGTYGGGMSLFDNSFMFLRPNTRIIFSNNHVTYVGGGIFVHPDILFSGFCFFQIDGVSQFDQANIQIEFENNTAESAGGAVYGGNVEFCINFQNFTGRNLFDSIFKVQNTDNDPSAISSDPYGICFCRNGRMQCSEETQIWLVYTYPGALFHVLAVVVGQKHGIVPGVIRATLIRNTSAVLDDLQESQYAGKSCTTLNYTVFSLHTVETILLGPEGLQKVPINFLEVNVTLLPCPWGFTLTGLPPKCNCADELQKHHVYDCHITNQTIIRPPPLWIGYYHPVNNSTHPIEGVFVHDNCPFDYCKPNELPIHLNNSDKQCAFNRSGILCGACKSGLSLALGTSRCLQCSNKHLFLLIVFAVAGFALVLLLTLTNMTVSEGAINGLIFYANIIHINRAIFFPANGSEILLHILTVFIAWINLDLGIQTCFYDGMNMYAKAWLQFLFPIYMWAIVGGMIVSSHYSTTIAKLFRRHAVKVLATLFLMSFAKLQRAIIVVLSFTFLTYPDGTKRAVWLYDSNIEYLHGKHIPLFLAALLALLLLLAPYTFVVLFIQCLQSKSSYRMLFWVRKLKPLLDAYAGPYNDRYRFWTGFLLLIRTILFLIFTLGNPGLNLTAIILVCACLSFVPRVYKKLQINVLEYSLLFNLTAVSAATMYSRYTQFNGNQVVVACISAGIAFLTFVLVLAYHIYKQCSISSRTCMNIVCCNHCSECCHPNEQEMTNISEAEHSEEAEGNEEPPEAKIRPLVMQFNEYREPVLTYDD